MKFLVTAGNTRQPIDRVRDWGNIFTGNTGFDIAKALAPLGSVDLFTSNPDHARQATAFNITPTLYKTHADLKSLLSAFVPSSNYHVIFMAAAVADYTPIGGYQILSKSPGKEPGTEIWTVQSAQAGKIKSTFDEIAFLGQKTQKLVDLFRTDWAFKGILVKFKLEVGVTTQELIKIGQASRIASGADYLVANELDMVQGTSGASPGAILLGENIEEWIPRTQLANRLVSLITGAWFPGQDQGRDRKP
jgi:phosphopantothenate---cysteine ligase (CTP)